MAGVLMLAGGLAPADEALPDAEFLEYLAAWDETDEEWLMFEESAPEALPDEDKRSDPAPEGEASTETEDEG